MKKAAVLQSFLFIMGSSCILSCNGLNDQLKDQAGITGAAQADRTIQATNEDNARKAAPMEQDLKARKRFYQCLGGIYEGTIEAPENDPLGGNRLVAVNLVPVLPPNHEVPGRVRTEAEITGDMNSLNFKVSVQMSDPSLPDVQIPGDGYIPGNFTTYNYDGVVSDLSSGSMDVVSVSNANQFKLWLSPKGVTPKGNDHASIGLSSAGLVKSVLDGSACQVPFLWIELRATKISTRIYGGELHRVEQQ